MSGRTDYRRTFLASYLGFFTQATVNNFVPLLFLTFRDTMGISLEKIGLLVTVNFVVQLLVDLISAHYVDRIGYRRAIVAAHILASAGLVGLTVLPQLFGNAYAGLLAAVIIYAIGGGLIEVLVSPIVEACPTEKKSASMSLLHSFYCLGHIVVVLVSTGFFALFGIGNWRILAVIWALIPAANSVIFAGAPINTPVSEGDGLSMRKLLGMRFFWVMALIMLCSGASELAMAQWASAFAEAGLGVPKAVGDLMGPCLFAVLMACSRLGYSFMSDRIDLRRYMILSCVLCIVGYIAACFSPLPLVSLIGCGIVGFAVAIFWPGTLSLAAADCPRGGTAMFALLALAGDTGCSVGPFIVGMVSGAAGDDLKLGLSTAIVFPVVLLICLVRRKKRRVS